MSEKTFDPKKYTPEEVEKINRKLIEQKLITPDRYYFDLRVIKDYVLGAIMYDLSKRPVDEARGLYQHVMAGMAAYQTRHYDECMSFKNTPYTTDYIEGILHDPKAALGVLAHAPITGCLNTLESHIIINANHSQLKENYKKVRVDDTHYRKDWTSVAFTINTYPLQLDEIGRDLIAAFFVDRFGVDVRVVYFRPKEIPGKIFSETDEFMLYRLDDFIESPMVHDILEPLQTLDKKMWVIPIFDPNKKMEFPPHKLRNERKLLKAYLDMYVSFDWLPVPMYACMPDKVPENHGLM